MSRPGITVGVQHGFVHARQPNRRVKPARAWLRPLLLILAAGSGLGLVVALLPTATTYAVVGLGVLGVLVLGVAWLLRAPEILLALYISIGSFKAALLPIQARLGFDFTIALALLVLLAIAIRILRTGGRIRLYWPILLAYLLLAAWMAFSLIWSPDQAYGREKVLRFGTLTLLALAGPMVLLDRWPRLERFLWALFVLGMVFTGRALASLAFEGGWQRLVAVLGADYLVVGQVCGLTALLGTYLLMDRDRAWWIRAVTLFSVVASVLVVFIGGARGPLVAWAAAFAAPALLAWRPAKKAVLAMGLIGAVLIVFVALWALGSLPQEITFRFQVAVAALVFRDPQAMQLFPHMNVWLAGWETFQAHPVLGAGVGGYVLPLVRIGSQPTAVVIVRYPHNMFLEAGAEVGIVGLALALFLVLLPLVKWRQCSKIRLPSDQKLLLDMVLAVYAFFFAGALKSGDFNTSRNFWMALGLVMSACLLVMGQARAAHNPAHSEP